MLGLALLLALGAVTTCGATDHLNRQAFQNQPGNMQAENEANFAPQQHTAAFHQQMADATLHHQSAVGDAQNDYHQQVVGTQYQQYPHYPYVPKTPSYVKDYTPQPKYPSNTYPHAAVEAVQDQVQDVDAVAQQNFQQHQQTYPSAPSYPAPVYPDKNYIKPPGYPANYVPIYNAVVPCNCKKVRAKIPSKLYKDNFDKEKDVDDKDYKVLAPQYSKANVNNLNREVITVVRGEPIGYVKHKIGDGEIPVGYLRIECDVKKPCKDSSSSESSSQEN